MGSRRRGGNLLLDGAEAVLAEKDLLPDVEGGRTEGAAGNRALGVLEQGVLDRLRLDARQRALTVEPGGVEGGADHLRVVHLLFLLPHGLEDDLDVAPKSGACAGRDR